MSSIRERIKAVMDLKTKLATVPEWGENEQPLKLLLRGMSGTMRAKAMGVAVGSGIDLEAAREGKAEEALASMSPEIMEKMAELFPAMVIQCALDPETKQRTFEDDDLAWLRDKNPDVLQRLGLEIMELSAVGEDALAEAKKD